MTNVPQKPRAPMTNLGKLRIDDWMLISGHVNIFCQVGKWTNELKNTSAWDIGKTELIKHTIDTCPAAQIKRHRRVPLS